MEDVKFWKNLTDFQKDVYKVVRTIPRGETKSYKWVAEQIGRPNAYRAVGQALKKNPRPDIIPCYRVIKENGDIGGYVKGKKLKEKKLKRESTMEIG